MTSSSSTVGRSYEMHVVTNWSSRAYSRTIDACQPMMKSVVREAWNRRQARSYCGWTLPSGVHRSAHVDRRCDQ